MTLSDDEGHPLPIKDVDLQLKLPSKFKHTTFKGKLRRLVQKLKKSTEDDIVYTIKERVKLTDSTTGQSYDVEMNLKVQIPASCSQSSAMKNNNSHHNLVKKSNSLPFVESLKKSVLCPMMPWRCRGGEKEDEEKRENSNCENDEFSRKSSEVGRKIFQAADVITKSPKKSKSFEDLTTLNNNDSREQSPNNISRV